MNFKDNSDLDWKTKSGGKKQTSVCGGRKTENLIELTCFYLKISRFPFFNVKVSQFHIFNKILVESACFEITIVLNWYLMVIS